MCTHMRTSVNTQQAAAFDCAVAHARGCVSYPRANDVLLCKGGNVKNAHHYGNIEFTDLIQRSSSMSTFEEKQHKSDKDNSSAYYGGYELDRRHKREAARQVIIDDVRSRGGRFLTLDETFPGGTRWFEIKSDPKLHQRVAASIYDHTDRSHTSSSQQKQTQNAKRMRRSFSSS